MVKVVRKIAAQKPMPKHLVLGGGLEAGLVEIGAVAELAEQDAIDMASVETVHATSAGAFAAVLLTAGLGAADIEKYVVDRPWDGLIAQAAGADRAPHPRKGLLSGVAFRTMFSSVLRAVDLGPDATLAELADGSRPRLRFYTADADTFQLVTLSADTHPELEAWRAVHMSAAYPVLFEPAYLDGRVYVDGGILCNFPVAQCLAEVALEDYGEVLCLRFPTGVACAPLAPDSDAGTHAERIVAGLVGVACPDAAIPEGVVCLDLPVPASGRAERILGALSSKQTRMALVIEGRSAARDFLLLHDSNAGQPLRSAPLRRVDSHNDSDVHNGVLPV
jgi:hypothetical protein